MPKKDTTKNPTAVTPRAFKKRVGRNLNGNIHQRNSKDNPWPVYMFNPQRHHWVPREVMKMQTELLTK